MAIGRWDRSSGFWAALSLHLAVAYAITFPAAHYVASSFFGWARGDRYQFVWIFWWVKRALVDLGELPFWTPLQYHPTGVSLTLHDMTYFWSLLSVPLQSWMSPATILNLFLLVCLPLNGLAFYALASHVSRSHWGALAGSMVFAYCPYLLGRFTVSHVQYLGVFFIPLFLLALSRFARDGRLIHLVLAGLWAGLESLISFYYGIALAALFVAFLVVHDFPLRRGLPPIAFSRKVLAQITATGLPAAMLTLPVIVPALVEIGSGAFGDRLGGSSMQRGSADLLAYFIPDRGVAQWRGWSLAPGLDAWVGDALAGSGSGVPERSVYPGWVGWGAAVVVLASGPLRRRAWPWLALAVGAMVVTLGPTLHVAGTAYLEGWMPARAIRWIPLLSIIRGPSRFAVFVTLGTGMLVALVIARVAADFGSRRAVLAAVGCMALTAVEFTPQRTVISPRSVASSPFYARLEADPDEYAVLNVPVDFRGAHGNADLYIYAQTIHQKPIVGGYVSREPVDVMKTLRDSLFLQAIEQRAYESDRRLELSDEGLRDMPESLERLGVRYVLVHHRDMPKAEWRRICRWLERGPLRQVYDGRELRAYEVIPRGRAGTR